MVVLSCSPDQLPFCKSFQSLHVPCHSELLVSSTQITETLSLQPGPTKICDMWIINLQAGLSPCLFTFAIPLKRGINWSILRLWRWRPEAVLYQCTSHRLSNCLFWLLNSQIVTTVISESLAPVLSILLLCLLCTGCAPHYAFSEGAKWSLASHDWIILSNNATEDLW